MTEKETKRPEDETTLIEQLIASRRVPSATYRLQLNQQFTLDDATAIVPYLHQLGISDVYISPPFVARTGSTHGYDVCDYSRISPALGGEEALLRLSAALRKRTMGLVLDMVPNHMGIGNDNPWWMDMLENGPASAYANFFDIDWQPVKPELANKVLLPILDDQYGAVLERGGFRLKFEEGVFFIDYNGLRLPLAPRTYATALAPALEELSASLDENDEALQELQSIITAIGYLPSRTEQDPARLAERMREKEVVKRRLASLCQSNLAVATAIESAISRFNGRANRPRSFDALEELLNAQPYRPAFWRVASEEINYRRFFDINDLAAIRVELPEVFAATHELVFRLLAEGHVTGLRIDHPDGLWDPPTYFRQLQQGYVQARLRAKNPKEGDAEPLELPPEARPLYVVAEKILSEREPLPHDWAVDGTTGYDFLAAVNGIFVNRSNERAFDRLYRRFIAPDDPTTAPSFGQVIYESKKLIMDNSLVSEVISIGHQMERVTEKNRRYRDFTLQGITGAISALIASLSIYRTYVTAPEQVAQRDVQFLDAALRFARRNNQRIPGALFSFLRDTLLLRNLHEFREEDRAEVLSAVMRFQQITGPVMAKSVEDTAFYRFNRLVSLNEVGGAPDQFGLSRDAFHHQNETRQREWPHAMLSTSTHDTKRGEDLRARLNVLSELPAEWESAITTWRDLNAAHKQTSDGEALPDANDEYLLYQTLLGAWPMLQLPLSSWQLAETNPGEAEAMANWKLPTANFRDRVGAYMQKATKEAKLHTSWINPDDEYDAALQGFIGALLAEGENPFLAAFLPFQRRIAFFGLFNSLSQTLLKLSAPGVPDIYQGSEGWNLSLVDPDNRRPVDFAKHQQWLNELQKPPKERLAFISALLDSATDGRLKLFLVQQTLAFRRRQPHLFTAGDYQPLPDAGDKSTHLCAFARSSNGMQLLVAVPRLIVGLTGGVEQIPIGPAVWGEAVLALPDAKPGQRYRDIFTDQTVVLSDDGVGLKLAQVFAHLPFALLLREE